MVTWLSCSRGIAVGCAACLSAPDGRLIATSGDDGTVRLWDGRDGQVLAKLEGHTAAVYAVVLSPDGGMVASVSLDGTARLWGR